MVGAFKANTWVAAFATMGLILSAGYMLYLYRRIVFGALTKDNLKAISDLDVREIVIFTPLLLIVIVMGVYPSLFLDVMHVSVENLVDRYQSALINAQHISAVNQ